MHSVLTYVRALQEARKHTGDDSGVDVKNLFLKVLYLHARHCSNDRVTHDFTSYSVGQEKQVVFGHRRSVNKGGSQRYLEHKTSEACKNALQTDILPNARLDFECKTVVLQLWE